MDYGPLITSLLSPVFAGRFYARVPPDDPGRSPLAIYQRVGGVPVYFSEGRLPDEQNARVQVYVWAETSKQVSQLVNQCRKLVSAHPDMLPLDVPVDDYNEVLKLHGAHFDVAVWHTI